MAGIGNDFVREARKRARLTQRELAEKVGTTQSAIARIETGRSAPSFDKVLELVYACGMDLDIMLVEYDGSDWMLARDMLALTPAQRTDYQVDVVNTMMAIQGVAVRDVGVA